jgi:hypothetical protein
MSADPQVMSREEYLEYGDFRLTLTVTGPVLERKDKLRWTLRVWATSSIEGAESHEKRGNVLRTVRRLLDLDDEAIQEPRTAGYTSYLTWELATGKVQTALTRFRYLTLAAEDGDRDNL